MSDILGGGIFNPSGIPATTPAEVISEKPKAEKRTTRKDVENLLAQFQPAAAPVQTKAEKERERLAASLEATVRKFGDDLVKLRILDGDLAKAEAAVKALASVGKNAGAAIAGISDTKLDPQEKAPRQTKPVVEEVADKDPEASMAVAEQAATTEPGYEEDVTRVLAEPRGAEDPNLNDGF